MNDRVRYRDQFTRRRGELTSLTRLCGPRDGLCWEKERCDHGVKQKAAPIGLSIARTSIWLERSRPSPSESPCLLARHDKAALLNEGPSALAEYERGFAINLYKLLNT
jgi:hypothetical protein